MYNSCNSYSEICVLKYTDLLVNYTENLLMNLTEHCTIIRTIESTR